MTKSVIWIVTLLLTICLTSNVSAQSELTTDTYAEDAENPIPYQAEVSAEIPGYQFILFGYASPHALVSLEGVGISDQTYANNKGYFAFINRFSPFSNKEACLSAKDQLGRSSRQVCLPPFPPTRNVNIGPVLVPPTISFDRPNYFVGDEVLLSGQTIPNTNVKLSYFIDERTSLFSSIIKPVNAAAFPSIEAQSDARGNYSVSVPSSYADVFRVFSQVDYDNQDSPQSVELSVKIYPFWMIIVQLLMMLLALLRSRLFETLIAAQIVILALYFLRRYLHPFVIHQSRAIVLRQMPELMLPKHEIVLKKKKRGR